jgi:hypothetical protein
MGKRWAFLDDVRSYFGGREDTVAPVPAQRLRLSGKRLRIPIQGNPVFEVDMGKQRLQIYPDLAADPRLRAFPPDFLLFDPERYLSGISPALRLKAGNNLAIDRNAEDQQHLFTHPREAFRRHLSVRHEGNALIFKDPISELGTYVSLLGDVRNHPEPLRRRERALERVIEIFGGPLERLSQDEGLETLRAVNRALREDPYRRKDAEGNPGGVVELPPEPTPIIVGDLHARLDNLLKILSENAFLEALERGEAILIFLGDAVHEEAGDQLGDMDNSLLMMDLIFKLKISHPNRVVFLIGNHDSFSPDVMKGGVPQGLLWERRVTELRGTEYAMELALFYQQSPLVILSRDFIACHAGPTRIKVSKDMLVNVRQFPGLVHELTWTRLKTPGFPAGYTRGDVRRFRKSVGVEKDTPFIVGHYPVSCDRTVWPHVGEVDNHHIVYSAKPDEVGLFTRIDGEMVPLVYPSEPLLGWVNERARTPKASRPAPPR